MGYIGNSKLYRFTTPSIVLEDYKTKVLERMSTNEVTGYEITFNDIADGELGYIGIYIDQLNQGEQNEDLYSVIVAWKIANSDNNVLAVYDLSYKIAECFDIPNNFVYEDTTLGVRSYIIVKKEVPISFTYDKKKVFTMYAVYDIKAAKQKTS
jgi:hypothetical protein